jgi:hypothetical protein
MGNTSFLTGLKSASPQSLNESIYQLGNSSVLFLSAWQSTPPDFKAAGRVTEEAMVHLDHIVNEILRARDQLKANEKFVGSNLETQLKIHRALSSNQVTRDLTLPLFNVSLNEASYAASFD